MTFRTGTVSYARFKVVGSSDGASDDERINAIQQHMLTPPSAGAPPEVQAGWCAGQHVYDQTFDRETMQFGDRLLFAMRVDVNRVPSEIRRAHRRMAEVAQADANPTGVLNRAERQAAREDAEARGREELAAGRYRSSSMVPVLYDRPRRIVLAPAFGDVKVSALTDLFASTFDCTLLPLSAGPLGAELLGARGATRDLEDARPTPFTPPPPAAASEDGRKLAVPPVPWSRGPEPSDFLGNEFLTWLWWRYAEHGGLIETTDGTIAVAIERALDMDCAWDVTGKQTLRAPGPSRLPEAVTALRTGKWPRKAGLLLARIGADDEQWGLVFQADRFLLTGIRLPKPEEAPASPRESIEGRLDSITALDAAMVDLFDAFLRQRIDSGWSSTRDAMSTWARRPRHAAAASPADAHLVDA